MCFFWLHTVVRRKKNRAARMVGARAHIALEDPARNCRLVLLREIYGGMGWEVPRRN